MDTVRTIFTQPDHPSALAQLHRVVDGLRPRFEAAAGMLEEAAEDVLAHLHFPEEHRRRLHSTNPLERLHREVKRRTAVVGIFPDRPSLVRLVGMLLAEQDDEWWSPTVVTSSSSPWPGSRSRREVCPRSYWRRSRR